MSTVDNETERFPSYVLYISRTSNSKLTHNLNFPISILIANVLVDQWEFHSICRLFSIILNMCVNGVIKTPVVHVP